MKKDRLNTEFPNNEKIVELKSTNKDKLIYLLVLYNDLGWDCDIDSITFDKSKKTYFSKIKLNLKKYNCIREYSDKRSMGIEIGKIIENKKEGFWFKFNSTKKFKSGLTVLPYKNNLRHGEVISFWRNGNICSIDKYENGFNTGKQTHYYRSGKIRSTWDQLIFIKGGEEKKSMINEDLSESFITDYFTNGLIKKKVQIVIRNNGEKGNDRFMIRLMGTDKFYNKDGLLIGTCESSDTYVPVCYNGVRVSYFICKGDQVEWIKIYNNGIEDGKWTYYNEDGSLRKEEIYENGNPIKQTNHIRKEYDYYDENETDTDLLIFKKCYLIKSENPLFEEIYIDKYIKMNPDYFDGIIKYDKYGKEMD
jgi:antitoxin component YwqK of YwqJK toxin-antitoxin module